jgi:acetyl-CoA carboxylase biotin carboxyl carrier protein
MKGKAMDIKDLEQIISLLKNTDITEFELDHGGSKVRFVRGQSQVVVSQTIPVPAHTAPTAAPAAHVTPPFPQAAPSSKSVEMPASFKKVESPLVGTFYRRPSPDKPLFAKEGDVVKKGQTLCIVEAMKLMNEIESPCDGKVEKILTSDGKVVEFGEVLFWINPTA